MKRNLVNSFYATLRTAAVAGALVIPMFGVASAGSLSGSYLAANQANLHNDYVAAARYYAKALSEDPSNAGLQQNLLFAYLASGDFERTVATAKLMKSSNVDSQLANLVVLTEHLKVGDYQAAQSIFDEGANFSPLLDGLMKGWLLLGLGNMSEATSVFDSLSSSEAMGLFGQYHKGLALAFAGDFEGADNILSNSATGPIRIDRGSVIAAVQIMTQADRSEEALTMLDQMLAGTNDLEMFEVRDAIRRDGAVPFTYIQSATDGAANVFMTLATVLASDRGDRFGLIYGRLAEYLQPGSVATLLVVAEILEEHQQHDLAVENYNKVPTEHPRFYNAELGRADALVNAGKPDDAIAVLRELSESRLDNSAIHVSLGNALRRESRFAEATVAYDAAIALIPEPTEAQWFLFYARGITLEREGFWERAEADFRKSLELSPDQPTVLNYLGYSLVEKGMKIEEAQGMIEIAAEKRPGDGYVIDSLGWVLYRINKFEEAVEPMERAVELLPVDPIVNDHLGDVYWKVGRVLEAEFQWRRALSFEPEEVDADRIRRKLEVGLDEVLKSEEDAAATND